MAAVDQKLEDTQTSPHNPPDVEEEVEESEEQRQAREDAESDARDRIRREKEARAQALTLEIIGDLPSAEVKPPENVLFVCKLNPVTEDEDLNLIFSRFGTIISCEVIRDKRTGDSLQYAFIEFENQKDCEQAYFKMQGVLIDDHRIHVDFSQSVSRLSDKWRTVTNTKRKRQEGGFGGVAELEKKRQYRAAEPKSKEREGSNGYGLVFDKIDVPQGRGVEPDRALSPRKRSRSRSPKESDRYRERTAPWDDGRRRNRSRERYRDRYDDERRRR